MNWSIDRGSAGAGEEARTLDIDLGRVALYQLSYSRMASGNLLVCDKAGIISWKASALPTELLPRPVHGTRHSAQKRFPL